MADDPSFPVAIITNYSHPTHGLRLLSFDGGGIRGLSSLLILREVMTRVQHEEGLNEPPSPWQYFDMITGTSTGGVYVNRLIAIMLGRLRMSVAEAIQCYSLLSERMFSGTKQRWQDGKFKATRLEQFIKEIIKKHSGSEDTRMLDDRPDACKVFVCAMSAQNMSALIPTLFRTYRSCQNESPNCMIWEAARATSAAPAFFKRITIADESSLGLEFIDGELGCNNPTARMLAEAKHIYRDRYIATIISIGTGQENTIALPKPGLRQKTLPLDVVGMLKKIATDCEKIAQDMAGRFEANPGVYFRFNVDQGMQSVGLGDWERLSDVAAHTHAYMRLHQNSQRADNAARAMKARNLAVDTATAGR